MTGEPPFHRYSTVARSYLARAEEHLKAFQEEGDAARFFYAALELRYGIEARLQEYIDAALRSLKQEPSDTLAYVATKLMQQLKKLNPDADKVQGIRIAEEGSGALAFSGHYTPVTPRLAKIHGMLGELLHYKFFGNNKNWFIKGASRGPGKQTLTDHAALLQEAVEELRMATSGVILHSSFIKAAVQSALDEGPPAETVDE
jgi:hypothetical protein